MVGVLGIACICGCFCYSPTFLSDFILPESMQDKRVCKTRECARLEGKWDHEVVSDSIASVHGYAVRQKVSLQ